MAEFDRRRFERHLLLAEIGEAGQARLCAARARLAPGADSRAAAVARDYLERAGVAVIEAQAARAQADAEAIALALPDAAVLRSLAGRPELDEAAASLAGALAAVDAIKTALGIGSSPPLSPGLSLGAEKNA